jgi:hypothetical protein
MNDSASDTIKVDTARLPLLLRELRLPTIAAMWQGFTERALAALLGCSRDQFEAGHNLDGPRFVACSTEMQRRLHKPLLATGATWSFRPRLQPTREIKSCHSGTPLCPACCPQILGYFKCRLSAEAHAGMARPEGLEPPTYRFEACCSVQLSYECDMAERFGRRYYRAATVLSPAVKMQDRLRVFPMRRPIIETKIHRGRAPEEGCRSCAPASDCFPT